jgi:hypothetical protein
MILLLLLLLLTSCTDNQVDWALDVFESWADAEGVNLSKGVDIGKATGYVAGQIADRIIYSDEYAALEMTHDLDKIKRADAIMDLAITSNNPDDLRTAKDIRPWDYKYSEAEAVLWMIKGNNAATNSSITTADSLAARMVEEGGDCRTARLNQLRVRRKLLLDKLDDPLVTKDAALQGKIYTAIGEVDNEIQALTGGQANNFCERLGKDIIPNP